MRQAGGCDRAPDQLGARILLAIAAGLEGAEGRERVHAVNHAGLFQSVPDRLVFRLKRIIAERIHRADERDPAALSGDPANLLDRVIRMLHRDQCGEEQPLGVGQGVFVGPFVVGAAKRLGAERVLQPGINIDLGRDDHDLIDALNVHVLEARLWFVGAGMVEIGHLLLSQRGLRVQIAHVEGALNIMLHPGPRIGDDPHRPGNAALTRRAEPDTGAAVDD